MIKTFGQFLAEAKGKSTFEAGQYVLRVCDGEGAASRGLDSSVVKNVRVSAKSEEEFINKVLVKIDAEWAQEDEDDKIRTVKDLYDFLDGIDVGDGSPFIFWIKKDNKVVYDSGLDEDGLA